MIRMMLSDILRDRLQVATMTPNAYQTDNLRMTIEGILWRFRTGAPWRACGGIETAEEKTIGPSRGGNTTKIQMLTDAYGNPTAFKITGGNILVGELSCRSLS